MSTTKSWGDAKQAPASDRKEIERLKIDTGGSAKVRLVGGVLCRYVRWVTTIEGKKMPVECLGFNRETEQFDGSPDPFDEIPENIFDEKPQFAYVANVIHREDNAIKLFDLKKTVYTQVIKYAQDPDYGNPADDVNGYDITISKEKTGPLAQNVKYSSFPGRSSTPLTNEEKELELYDLDKLHKRQTYEEQKEWLIQNTTYFLSEGGPEMQDSGETAEDLD